MQKEAENMRFKLFYLIMAIFLLCSCNGSIDKKKEFSAEIEKINTRHAYETKLVPDIKIKDYTSSRHPFRLDFSIDELNRLINYDTIGFDSNPIKYEEAAEDVEFMFRVLKNCYGAYYYFGGDEAFEEAKKQVLYDCKTYGDNLKVGLLKDSLINNLEFIKDGHFSINGDVTYNKARYYSNDDIGFQKDEKGYFTIEEEKKKYVYLVDGDKEVEKYMKISINDEGALICRLGVLSFEELEFLEVDFDDESVKVTLSLPEAFRADVNFSFENIDNIPVVAIRSFLDKEASKQFVDTAQMLKESPIAILDLRRNGGGRATYIKRWLDVYAPELSEYYLGNMWTVLHTRSGKYLNSYRYKANLTEKDEMLAKMNYNLYRGNGNWWETNEFPAIDQIERDNMLFVLFDGNTFSSGEILAAVLRNIKNVIFIGSNSKGGLLGDGGVRIVLPNSQIHIICSCGIRFFYDETVVSDQKGLEPDIWVRGDSLKSVLNMISYYNLR